MSGEVYDHTAGTLSDLDREVVKFVPPGGNWRDLPDDFQSARIAQIRRSAAAGEGSRSTYYGRLSADRPSYTVSTYFNRPGNGCFIHPIAPRLISIREAARLQAFPDGYRFTGRGRARFIQVGNAVPPLLAYQIAKTIKPRAKFIDLFAGAGGLALGFEWAGHQLVAAVDENPACMATLLANDIEPARALRRDLSQPETLREVLSEIVALNGGGEVDVLVGGPPCQGFSTAGNNHADDPRNRLMEVFLNAVAALKPKYVLVENVPALAFRRRRSTLKSIIATFEDLDYTVDYAILHAEAYGVPQLRRRLFIQAVRGRRPQWPAPRCRVVAPHQMARQPGGSRTDALRAAPTVGNAIGDLPAETVVDPDMPARYCEPATASFQRWARGIISTSELVPEVVPIPAADQLELEAA